MNNYNIWTDEWKLHGTCSHNETDYIAYLNRVNYCRKMTILNTILRVAKIISDNAIIYGVALINSTIYDSDLKAIPELYCKQQEKTELYLSEIKLCFSNNVQKLTLINCIPIKVIKIGLDIK